jgi:hypothetical protein
VAGAGTAGFVGKGNVKPKKHHKKHKPRHHARPPKDIHYTP